MSHWRSLILSVGLVGLGCLLAQASPALAAASSSQGNPDSSTAGLYLVQSGTTGSGMGQPPSTGGAPGFSGAGPGRNDSTGATKQDGRDHSSQGGSGHSGNAMTEDPATKSRPTPPRR